MNIFIDGATGFIGSHMMNKLKEEHKVVMLFRDCVWNDWLKEAREGCVRVRGDVLNFRLLKRVLSQYEIEQVYHFAAQAIVRVAQKDPIGCFNTNVMGTVNILEACRQLDVDKVLVMSTDKIFGNVMNAHTKTPLSATEPYGTSKACQDLIAQTFLETYGMNIIVPRSCNAYGYDLSNRIIPNTIRACLRGESPVIFEGEETRRQYICITDLCEALIHLMKHHSYKGVYNIATDNVLTQEEVVKTICDFFSISPRYVKRKKPIHEIKSQSMICSSFGWRHKYSFRDGIKETIKRFKRYGF